MPPKQKVQFRETFDKKFQRKVVRTLFHDQKFVSVVRTILKPSYLEDPIYEWILDKLYFAYDQDDRLTCQRLKHELKDAIRHSLIDEEEEPFYLDQVSNLKRKVLDPFYVRETVREFVERARLRSGLLKTAIALEEETDTAKAILELDKLSQVLHQGSNVIAHDEFYKHTRDFLKRGPGKIERGVSTGLHTLDRDMGESSGLPPRRLACLAATSGAGKTLVLTHFGSTAVKQFCKENSNEVLLHLSGEDDQQAMFQRYQSSILGVPTRMLKSKRYIKQVRKRHKHITAQYGKGWESKLCVLEMESNELTTDNIYGMMVYLENLGKPVGLLIVDYADLLRGKDLKRDDNEHTSTQNVFKNLKDLLKKVNTPGWTASQVGKAKQGARHLRAKDLYGTSSKIFTSDVVLTFGQDDKEKTAGRGRFYVDKMRFGKDKREFKVTIDYEKQRVKEVGTI